MSSSENVVLRSETAMKQYFRLHIFFQHDTHGTHHHIIFAKKCALFSLKSNIFPLISHSKQMSKMYIERWLSAKQYLKCTLNAEAQQNDVLNVH